jgi:hypothetical protein
MKETARLFSTTQSDVAVSKTDGVSAEKLPDDRDRVFVGAMQELIDAGVANRWQGICTKIAVGYYAKSHTGEVIHDAVVKGHCVWTLKLHSRDFLFRTEDYSSSFARRRLP